MKSKKPTSKSQKYRDNSAKKTGRARSLENLKPFNTGYDPRRNYHGRPKDIDQLRDMIRDIGQSEVELKDGNKVSRLYLKAMEMFDSRDPRDNALILSYGWGKVPDELKVKSWQDEIIQALKEKLISPIEVVQVLGIDDARPILIAASATAIIDSPAAETASSESGASSSESNAAP